jgi:hypothetical protein
MRKYYHATPFKNFSSILDNGIKVGYDGITYLAETKEDAYRFIALRCFETVLVIEVELDESKVVETFDHNPNFFKCKAFGYPELITANEMISFWKFERN